MSDSNSDLTYGGAVINGRYERATGDLRVVLSTMPRDDRDCLVRSPDITYVSAIQRRFLIQDGPVQDALHAVPPFDPDTWMKHPGLPLHWFLVKSEWRDLPAVDVAVVRAEGAEHKTPQISTNE